MTKVILLLQSFGGLIAHDLFMTSHRFSSLHERVRQFPVRASNPRAKSIDILVFAFDIACCFYPKRVLCLQRSAVLVKILRRYGIPAHMVIGAQRLPFRAHAWVEVNGEIIDDRVAAREKFLVLEVC
jgi:hypothetical protein